MAMAARAALLVLVPVVASSSSWCENASAPAIPGMYGNLSGIDLSPWDLPSDTAVVALFQQAVTQLYGFNNREALRSFSTAAALEPNCALCHWGVAMSLAPNINYHVERQDLLNAAAHRAAAAASLHTNLTMKTRRLVDGVGEMRPRVKKCRWRRTAVSARATDFEL